MVVPVIVLYSLVIVLCVSRLKILRVNCAFYDVERDVSFVVWSVEAVVFVEALRQ